MRRPPDADDRNGHRHLTLARARRRRWGPAVALLCGLVAVACTRSGDSPQLGIIPVSTPLPAITGTTLQGGSVAATGLKGKVLVVNVWATWCGPCRQEQPALQDVWSRYRNRGVEFVGINYRDDDAAAKEWIRQFGVTYPSIPDQAGAYAADFAFFGLPDTYVVDRSGTIRYWINTAVDAQELSGLLDQVLARP